MKMKIKIVRGLEYLRYSALAFQEVGLWDGEDYEFFFFGGGRQYSKKVMENLTLKNGIYRVS